MSSRMHGSEEAMATLACQRLRTSKQPSVLIGGLGMGFTLRTTLDLLPQDAAVLVVELLPAGLAASNNDELYNPRGIAAARAALKKDGVLAIWAAQDDRKFEQQLRDARFDVQVH